MPCALTQGYTLDCKESIGGIKAVWFIPFADVTTITEASGVVTTITKSASKVFYKYQLVKQTSSLTENITASVENGKYLTPSVIPPHLDIKRSWSKI